MKQWRSQGSVQRRVAGVRKLIGKACCKDTQLVAVSWSGYTPFVTTVRPRKNTDVKALSSSSSSSEVGGGRRWGLGDDSFRHRPIRPSTIKDHKNPQSLPSRLRNLKTSSRLMTETKTEPTVLADFWGDNLCSLYFCFPR